MIAPNSFRSSHFRAFSGVFHGARAVAVALALALVTAPDALAQGQLDQVTTVDRRGRVKTVRGHLVENTLEATVIEFGGKEERFDADEVRAVRVGDVPTAYSEGLAYLQRDDLENAAAQFEAVAGDASERDVVRAAARLHAAEAWLRRGGADRAAFGEARKQLERFLADHPNHRDLPRARAMLARAQRLAGDLAKAAETYTALYGEVKGGTPPTGYTLADGFAAGLEAADCLLDAGDVDGARALYGELSSAVTSAMAGLDRDAPERTELASIEMRARLGDGFCLLASGSTTQAKTFFEGQLNSAAKLSSQRFGARYGLGRVYLAEARYRAAANEFAQVSAIDFSDRDRAAAALIGLAECALKLSDADGEEQAQRWLRAVIDHYGDTPSVLRARELSKSL